MVYADVFLYAQTATLDYNFNELKVLETCLDINELDVLMFWKQA